MRAASVISKGYSRRHLVDNSHPTILVLEPDRDLAECEAWEEHARLEAVRAGMTVLDLRGVVEATNTLKRMQREPDPLEALATIPTLSLSDLSRANKLVPCEVTSLSDTRVLYHDLFTNGVVYLDVGFDLHILPPELLAYVPLFGRALGRSGSQPGRGARNCGCSPIGRRRSRPRRSRR